MQDKRIHAIFPNSLRQRVLNAGMWSFAAFALSQVIRFGSNLVMSRLLAPEMFGVVAIATAVMVGFAMIFDVGLKPNIVQSKRGSDPAFLNMAWTIQILHGVVICIGTVCIGVLLFVLNKSKLIAAGTVYADPLLVNVIFVISIAALVSGVRSTKYYEANRSLSLNRIALIEIFSQLAAVAAMIGWAYNDPSIWAIVAGLITSNIVSTVLSHTWLPGVSNRWHWDALAFKEIIYFGKWIFLSSALGFLASNGDRLLLGNFVTPALLGAYAIAFVIFAAVDQLASRLITEISFPAFSEVVRDRRQDLKATYYRFHIIIGFVTYLCAGILYVSGQSLIEFLYDQRYHDAGWMLEILALAIAATPYQLAAQLYMVFGTPRLYYRLAALRLAGLVIFTSLGFALFGVTGAVWGIMLSYWPGVPMIIFHMIKYGVFDFRKELMLLPILALGMLAGKMINVLLAHHVFLF